MTSILRSSRHANLTASHKRAPKMEKAHAKKLGIAQVPGSGVGQMKGDLRKTGIARLELKTTGKKSFPVTVDLIQRIEAAVVGTGELPAIIVEFNDGHGAVLATCAIVPLYALHDLLSR